MSDDPTKGRAVRYAVVGAGWIAQQVFMPGVAHTGNSVLAGLVTGDPEKGRALAAKYGIPRVCGYDGYEALLRSGAIDAVYVATPNTLHREHAVAALEAGVHVLCEKPLADSEENAQAMIDAARTGGAKLMVAYRLHFEPATVEALELVHAGRIGEVRLFNSTFTQQVAGANHRARDGYGADPVADMGPYPINMARHVFQADPVEVMALSTRGDERRFGDVPESVAVLMRFPGDRLAQFVVSFGAEALDAYRIVGTEGNLHAQPGFDFMAPLEFRLTTPAGTEERRFPHTDQFGGELRYFSDCILEDREPQPDGEEGLADVRVVLAIQESLRTGRPVAVEPVRRPRTPRADQVATLPFVMEPDLVNASPPSDG
ncbi:Gfo/Idh/MocA family protein [Azospirillum halopraeferens]|uniref:Gfo/Idh/MocA family protein n=1 Tax=Azospirillum halopraeferens TaxID=34010 RepID=UPI000407D37C|nr:Gfo/Idh/MocA family oxidoreductase [Azospirillum halopraeferens]